MRSIKLETKRAWGGVRGKELGEHSVMKVNREDNFKWGRMPTVWNVMGRSYKLRAEICLFRFDFYKSLTILVNTV